MDDEIERRLTDIESRVSAATARPWYSYEGVLGAALDTHGAPTDVIARFCRKGNPEFFCASDVNDAHFCAHARTEIPWLIEQVRMLRDFICNYATMSNASRAFDSAFQKYSKLLEKLAD